MPRARTLATLVVAAAVGVALGETFSFDSTAYFGVLLAVMFVASLSDRDRFYARDLTKGSARRARPAAHD